MELKRNTKHGNNVLKVKASGFSVAKAQWFNLWTFPAIKKLWHYVNWFI